MPFSFVMAGLGRAIQFLKHRIDFNLDGPHEAGHDGKVGG